MEEALELSRAKDTKVRMAGVERLHQLLESSRKSLSSSEVTSLVDTCLDLLKDNNFRVSQGGLLALASAAVLSGDHFKIHFNSLVPAAVDRLGDNKQPVRDAARRLLITLMEVSSPTIIVERAGSFAWEHKSWRVREEFARTVTAAINLFASTELPLQRAILTPILHMLNDPNHSVREAAISCIEEMYTQIGPQLQEELNRHQLPSYMIKDINARLEKIEPKPRSSDGAARSSAVEHKPSTNNTKRSSPKAKNLSRESSLFGGDGDVVEKPVEPVKVYSEKELVREIEKIAATLVPEKDWSVRIAAMQRVEGLVLGGGADYPSFRGLLKQLVGPLCTQLADRRSSIVKQACHLLNFLSKELLGDFETCAEQFIPALFKLVVITVLVIAESADNCIKTMLRNCKVARVLPRIADCAKNDKNAALRARCCDYALLVLEHWPDEPEIQRSADLYEDVIRRCVGDAVSEVRTTARACYRMFARTWPERARRLFQSFDPVIQRIINEEDGGLHRRHASPSVRERSVAFTPQSSASLNLPGYGNSAIVAMDKSSTLASRVSVSSGTLLSQSKTLDKRSDRTLESVLSSSKEKVSAIENLLRGLDLSSKHNSSVKSSSLDLGVDAPSSRDPPFPFAVPASNQVTNLSLDSQLSATHEKSHRNGSLAFSDLFPRKHASKDAGKFPQRSGLSNEPLSALSSYSAKRASERGHERTLIEELTDMRDARRYMTSHSERQFADTPYRDSNFRDSQASHVPNFQRPLSRKNVTGRSMSSSRRRSFDDTHSPQGERPSYTEGPSSLHDALSEGLSSTSDWSARVAAFNYIRSLLQQGAGGIQEVVQSFEKVMKLFFKHLDDPHHKVAQAALLTLADVIPSCRKPFESYMERILPHVFSRLIDPKELVRQPCSATLDIVSKTYGVDSLLPALLRSLDEQRSPKAKLAVIEFAIGSFNKHSASPEGAANFGILNIWLAKLTPLVHDKNTKLKEAAISCFISVYTHYDPTNVLNFILSLSVEEQNSLRRALKQYTPRIEVDLMNFLQSKKERHRSKSSYDQSDILGTSSEEGYAGLSKKPQYFGRYSGNSLENDGGRKWNSMVEPGQVSNWSNQASVDEAQEQPYEGLDTTSSYESSRIKDMKYLGNYTGESLESWNSRLDRTDNSDNIRVLSTPRLDTNGLKSSENIGVNAGLQLENGTADDEFTEPPKAEPLTIVPVSETGPSIPKILHLISYGNEGSPTSSKNAALHQLIEASVSNDPIVWSKCFGVERVVVLLLRGDPIDTVAGEMIKSSENSEPWIIVYFNQILTAVFEVLDDSDSSVRELALLLISEMLKNQRDSIEESMEIVIEKLLHVSKDTTPKVANEAENCLTTMLAQYDPFRCLTVITPLLVTDDEKTLVSCINGLTKLVGRLSPEELTEQLSSFLPALFDAFGNPSADVRKTVVFCLVDIYIMLGKAFLPYMEGLNSTQLRLVTIYANRISQARTGTPIDSSTQ